MRNIKEIISGIIIIVNEILSGRTKDLNTSALSKWLNSIGIKVVESRTIPDVEQIIVNTVKELKQKYDYVFTSGGIGPTHDDITAESIAKTFGLKYRILRLCNVYGRGDSGTSKQKNALQYLINQLRANKPISLYYNGEFYRDYMHVDDISRAINLCIKKAPINCIINIGTGEKVLFRSIIEMACTLLESSSIINSIKPPVFHKIIQVKDFYMNINKLNSTGFRPEIKLKEGIKELCQP